MAPTLSDYKEALKDIASKTCKWCKAELDYDQLEHHDHSDGDPVEGYDEKQWIITVCPGCEYQWAIHKLLVGKWDEWKKRLGEI